MNKGRTITTAILLLMLTTIPLGTVYAQKTDDPEPPSREVEDDNANLEEPEDYDDDNDPIVPIIYDDSGKIESPFQVELTVGTQSAWNKKIPLMVTITPLIDSNRTEISWDSGYGLQFEEKYEDFFPLAKGETATYKALLVPSEEGTYSITVSVTDWGYGRNYTSTDDITLTIDQDLLADPRTEGYSLSVGIKYAVIILLIIIIVGIVVYFGRYLIDWLKEWLKPPEY